MKSYKNQQRLSLIFRYVLIIVLAAVWIFPIIWMVLASFSVNNFTGFIQTFIPHQWTLANYVQLFHNSMFPYGSWLINTFIVALVTMVGSTFLNIIVSYTLSRLRFKLRKPFLQFALILGMFPGLMSMISLYYILKALNMLNLVGLTLIYVGGAGLGFYIVKGFLDTIPRSIDEAAMIDGATRWQIFTHITLPLARPMLIYTALMSFMGPWLDFLLPSIIVGGQSPANRTIAYGLQNMINNSRGASSEYFVSFIAGCVIIAVPITVLFIVMQRFYVNGITAGADKG